MEKAREFQKSIYFCFIDYAKAFDCVDHNKLWKILREMGIPDHLTCLLINLYAGQEQQLELYMEQQPGSKQEKEYIKAEYCHPAYLTYMQREIDGETVETVSDFTFGGSQITANGDCSHDKRDAYSLEGKL